jgi:L-ascorbate metabolism protein UlaG (beta-lactamase superfamily)
VKVKWLGHSAFLLTASDGTRIITDPYQPGAFQGAISYGPITERADFVTVSHNHLDHNHVKGVPGEPKTIRSAGTRKAGAVTVFGFESFHDSEQGVQRGGNIIFVFEDAGLRVAHLGDLGHVPVKQAAAMGRVDVLLLPVGGHFTIGPEEARKTVELLAARVIIPMHFATGRTKMPISGAEEFTGGMPNVKRVGASETEITADTLPATPEVRVLEHAL